MWGYRWKCLEARGILGSAPDSWGNRMLLFFSLAGPRAARNGPKPVYSMVLHIIEHGTQWHSHSSIPGLYPPTTDVRQVGGFLGVA